MPTATVRNPHLTLELLPGKVIFAISDWLYPADCICFFICSKRLYCLYSQQMQLVCLPGKETLSFLARYEHDHPEYFACEICKKLHLYDGSESFGLAAGRNMNQLECRLRCVRSGKWTSPARVMEDHIWGYHAQAFSFLHLKLAMKRFRYGEEYGISLDSLLHKQVIIDDVSLYLFSRDGSIG